MEPSRYTLETKKKQGAVVVWITVAKLLMYDVLFWLLYSQTCCSFHVKRPVTGHSVWICNGKHRMSSPVQYESECKLNEISHLAISDTEHWVLWILLTAKKTNEWRQWVNLDQRDKGNWHQPWSKKRFSFFGSSHRSEGGCFRVGGVCDTNTNTNNYINVRSKADK